MSSSRLAGAAFVLGCLLAAGDRSVAQDASVGPEWESFGKIATQFNDATFLLVSRVLQPDGTMESSTLRIAFRKPHYARCEVVDGHGAGGVAVWRGGDKVLVRPPGLLSRFVLALDRNDAHVVDARGRGCGQTTLENFATDFEAGGAVSESPGPEVAGESTDVVTWIRNPGASGTDSKKELFIAKATHLPVESEEFAGEKLVAQSYYKDIRLDVGLPFDTFQL
jgi:hypothetical protein